MQYLLSLCTIYRFNNNRLVSAFLVSWLSRASRRPAHSYSDVSICQCGRHPLHPSSWPCIWWLALVASDNLRLCPVLSHSILLILFVIQSHLTAYSTSLSLSLPHFTGIMPSHTSHTVSCLSLSHKTTKFVVWENCCKLKLYLIL